ncbi:hypothetical protein [Rugamonas sp.]|uniref:hypothetical protein n=1 Tax=Rugamonas sp. TaxID=1926287 RepID=UPI0025CDBA62|nr:hypothetical protein [Rugamonas sp.]
MSRLLIPDAGPLFSLAAGNLLALLAHFNVGITDVVRDETIDRGHRPDASAEARSILAYYKQNPSTIQIFATQVGVNLAALKAVDPAYQIPRNLGELSIQSLLIDLQMKEPGANPVVLFEDHWFLHHGAMLAKPCTLLSTQAFLAYAESKNWIPSAEIARRMIARTRGGFC